jgi:hypothetical protein
MMQTPIVQNMSFSFYKRVSSCDFEDDSYYNGEVIDVNDYANDLEGLLKTEI